MVINIQDDILKLHSLGLLDKLLTDKTTGKRIMWATDAYTDLGSRYGRNEEIRPELITGTNSSVIKPRARKEMEQQSSRTRQRGEVFTPLWVCEKMCAYADEMWDSKAGWQKYVDARVLEITCGEAPFLVSRYDAESGEAIPVFKRIGLLDRKLQAVNENAKTEEEWLKWAYRAFHSTYGYEFQGDNLLIARVNLLMTFEEYLLDRWKRKPTISEYGKLITVIVWNIWQMDGLQGTIPYGSAEEEFRQFNLFEFLGEMPESDIENKQPRCRVYNWLGGGSVEYSALPIRGKRAMKFDFVIGNPPYQEEAPGESTSDKPIYHYFMDATFEVSRKVELITPARFLFNAGSTPKQWNQKMLSSHQVKVEYYESDAKKVFPNTAITGGIAITYYDKDKDYPPIEIFVPYMELNKIRQKVLAYARFKSFSNIVSGRTPYLFTDELHNQHPDAKDNLSKGHLYDVSSNAFISLPDVFFSELPEDMDNYLRVLGRFNNNRTYRWIKKKYVRGRSSDFIGKWKVFLPKANGASGMLGEEPARLISRPVLGMPTDAATDTFIVIGPFNHESEATAALKYINSKFARVLLGILKVTQINSKETWRYVPLQDFTSTSDIDWTQSIPEIDQQLYKKYGLDETEIQFIETHVKEMT